jgi:hypothetical protein
MEFLQWMFTNLWHFLGMIILISVIGSLINGFVRAAAGKRESDDE